MSPNACYCRKQVCLGIQQSLYVDTDELAISQSLCQLPQGPDSMHFKECCIDPSDGLLGFVEGKILCVRFLKWASRIAVVRHNQIPGAEEFIYKIREDSWMFYSNGEFAHSLWEFQPNMLKSKAIKQTNVLACSMVPLDLYSKSQIDYWEVGRPGFSY